MSKLVTQRTFKKKHSVFIRVFLTLGFLVLVNTLAFALMVIPLQEKSLLKVLYTQAETISRSIVQASADAMMSDDYGYIVEYNVQVLKNNKAVKYIFIESQRGQKIWADQKGWKLLEETPRQFNHLINPQLQPAYDLIHYQQNEESFHFVYPVTFASIHWGWLHIGFSSNEYRHNIHAMYYQVASIALVLIVLILVAGFLFARWITHPITRISELASKVAAGDLSVKADIQRNDEIGQLADSFNEMIEALRHSKVELENYNLNLSQEVKLRTKELALLNQSLDKRVKNEVATRRQQEQLLIHQSRLAAMGEMIGAIAHQWRQPLNALGLVLQNIQLTNKYGHLDKEFIERAINKSDRLIGNMSATIDDFRNFFKPDKHAEKFQASDMLNNVAELMEASLKNNHTDLVIQCDDQLYITGYRTELTQVILNLINNAKDSCFERKIKNPKIEVIVSRLSGGFVELSVCDNGGGVSEDIMEKIYDPYFTTKEEGKGTGIGLYMSKMIIENNMEGTLSNHNSNHGSCFVVKIPDKPLNPSKPIITDSAV